MIFEFSAELATAKHRWRVESRNYSFWNLGRWQTNITTPSPSFDDSNFFYVRVNSGVLAEVKPEFSVLLPSSLARSHSGRETLRDTSQVTSRERMKWLKFRPAPVNWGFFSVAKSAWWIEDDIQNMTLNYLMASLAGFFPPRRTKRRFNWKARWVRRRREW